MIRYIIIIVIIIIIILKVVGAFLGRFQILRAVLRVSTR